MNRNGVCFVFPANRLSSARGLCPCSASYSYTYSCSHPLATPGAGKGIVTDGSPINFRDLGRTLSSIVSSVQAPAFVGEERTGGLKTRRIKGTVSSEVLVSLVPGAARGLKVGLELWVDDRKSRSIGMAIASNVLSPRRRGLALGIIGAAAEAGSVLGPLYGCYPVSGRDSSNYSRGQHPPYSQLLKADG